MKREIIDMIIAAITAWILSVMCWASAVGQVVKALSDDQPGRLIVAAVLAAIGFAFHRVDLHHRKRATEMGGGQ